MNRLSHVEHRSDQTRRRRDDEDAAVVLALINALSVSLPSKAPPVGRAFWANPSVRAGTAPPSTPGAWWASGLPR